MRIILSSLLLFSSLTFAAGWEASGGGQLLELYTSEGCSSCPPADQWISGLKKNPDLWRKFVPLSFHVDYWDGLGWPDKFASAVYTQRQREYSRSWNKSSVYTPEFVIQGKESGRRQDFVESKLILEARFNGGKLALKGKFPAGYRVHYAWLGMDIKSVIKRGENSGKTLEHNFVVLKMGELGFYKEGEYSLNQDNKTVEPSKALAIWLENEGIPIVAVGNLL